MEPLDLSFVAPRLACGARFSPKRAAELAGALGIRSVVDLRLEERDDEAVLRRHGIRLLHLPTADRCAIAPHHLDLGVEWVADALGRGDRVLIHCQHGIGRSAMLTLCVLVREGHALLDALRLCKDLRPVVSPSPEQLEGLLAWASTYGARAARELPSFDELAAIAYRHLQQAG